MRKLHESIFSNQIEPLDVVVFWRFTTNKIEQLLAIGEFLELSLKIGRLL